MAQSAKAFQDLFTTNLAHKTNLLKDQTENGLYVVKRVGAYLKKISTAQKQAAVTLLTISDHEKEKRGRAEKDGMQTHVLAYEAVQDTIRKAAVAQKKWSDDLETKVVVPVQNFYKEQEARRKKLVQQEDQHLAKLLAVEKNVENERNASLKMYQSLQESEKARVKEEGRAAEVKAQGKDNAKEVQKKAEKVSQARDKCHKAFKKFEELVVKSNQEQVAHYKRDLPVVIKGYEMLEVERLAFLEQMLDEINKISAEWAAPLASWVQTEKEAIDKIECEAEVKKWVDDQVKKEGTPPAIKPFRIRLPCASNSLAKDGDPVRKLLAVDVRDSIKKREAELGESDELKSAADNIHVERDSTIESPVAASPRSNPAVDFGTDHDPSLLVVKGLYNFDAQDTCDITMTTGDIIIVLSKGEKETGSNAPSQWWRGYRANDGGGRGPDGLFPSNYVEEVNVAAEMSFVHFMQLPSGVKLLTYFLEQEYSQENIEFWKAVEEWRSFAMKDMNEKKTVSDRCVKLAKQIVDDYISESGKKQVNVPSEIQKELMDALDKEDKLTPKFFDNAQKEVFKMLNADSWARLRKSPLFSDWLSRKGVVTAHAVSVAKKHDDDDDD